MESDSCEEIKVPTSTKKEVNYNTTIEAKWIVSSQEEFNNVWMGVMEVCPENLVYVQ